MTETETKLTVEQFDAQYTHIQDQLRAKQEKVDGYADQSFASLFRKSGWTQQEIADKVGITHGRVSQLLTFGRFLDFVTQGNKHSIPPNLTEKAFRKHWGETPSEKKDEARFHLVIKRMIEGDVIPDESESLRTKIVKACAEFASKKQIVETVGCTAKQFEDNWNHINKDKRYVVQHNKGSVRNRKLIEKIESCLIDIENQGNVTSMAEYAPEMIRAAAQQIRKIIEQLSK
jgi:predicted XRE-type DNA-binding protein